MNEPARVGRTPAPRLTYLRPVPDPDERALAALTARIDLIAIHVAGIEAENIVLRERCDLLAAALEPLNQTLRRPLPHEYLVRLTDTPQIMALNAVDHARLNAELLPHRLSERDR
jgi:hypothetical protein